MPEVAGSRGFDNAPRMAMRKLRSRYHSDLQGSRLADVSVPVKKRQRLVSRRELIPAAKRGENSCEYGCVFGIDPYHPVIQYVPSYDSDDGGFDPDPPSPTDKVFPSLETVAKFKGFRVSDHIGFDGFDERYKSKLLSW